PVNLFITLDLPTFGMPITITLIGLGNNPLAFNFSKTGLASFKILSTIKGTSFLSLVVVKMQGQLYFFSIFSYQILFNLSSATSDLFKRTIFNLFPVNFSEF